MGRKKRIRNAEGKLVMVPAEPSKKETRKDGKVDLLNAKAELSKAKAEKRKWLFMLIAAGLAAYFIFSSGAGSGALNFIKGFLPGGE